jgi:acetylornithine deacetylase/succinyl-diaminopimelate desuccinylase-like protein
MLRDLIIKPKLMDNPITRAAIINTVHLTGLGGENEPNVVPSEVYAILDCRLQPGVVPEEFVADLRQMVGPKIRFEVLTANPGNLSEWDDPLYHALARYAVEGEPNSIAGPVISVGYTDSNYLRPLGVRAYGFEPVVLTAAEMEGFHGHNERISKKNMEDGLRKLFSAVVEVSAQ